jgi:hypothetical protein
MSEFRISERLAAKANLVPLALHDAFPGVLFGRVLVLSSRLGVFDTLDRTPLTAAGLSSRLKLSLPGAELVLSSLHARGYLKKHRLTYSLAPAAKKWLVRSSPHSINGFLRYLELLHSRWDSLETSLTEGRSADPYVTSFGQNEWSMYIEGMMDLARLIIPRLLPKLTLPRGAESLLDIGGSHGLYAIELCRLHPRLKATVADLPPALSRTDEIIREYGLSDRIELLPCDITTESLEPACHDAVLLFNIVHGFGPETNRMILGKARTALKPGGALFILDQFKRERSSGADRLLPLMVGINLLNEIGGTVYDVEEVANWCVEAGFGRIKSRRLSLPGVGVLCGVKES